MASLRSDAMLERLVAMSTALAPERPGPRVPGLAALWPCIRSWWSIAAEDVPRAADVIGFECVITGFRDPRSEAEPPDGLPQGRLASMAFFREPDRDAVSGEQGVELWFAADQRWIAALEQGPVDVGMPGQASGVGSGGPGSDELADWVESLPVFRLALDRDSEMARFFSTSQGDRLLLRPGPRPG
jgi:hypothetical protein